MKKRERFLLILLAAMVILLGGYKFLIEPQMGALAEAKSELELAQIDKQKAEENVRRSETIENENKELEETIAEDSLVFFPELENDRIHIYFDEIANSVGISYASFSMGARAVSAINPFQPVKKSIDYSLKNSANLINIMNEIEEPNSSSSNKDDEVEDSAELEKMVVSLQFTANYNQMKSFLDAIKNSQRTARIVSLSTSEIDGVLTVSASIECFGIKKISDDPLANNTLDTPSGRPSPF